MPTLRDQEDEYFLTEDSGEEHAGKLELCYVLLGSREHWAEN